MSFSKVTGPIEKVDNRLYDGKTSTSRYKDKFKQGKGFGGGEMFAMRLAE